MSIHAALHHVTEYDYDRLVELGPQIVRLRPAPHCRSHILSYSLTNDKKFTVGVSSKQCNNKNPTNAQLYFTTARGFSSLLQSNGIPVSSTAVDALRQFCGDSGFRPLDSPCLFK